MEFAPWGLSLPICDRQTHSTVRKPRPKGGSAQPQAPRPLLVSLRVVSLKGSLATRASRQSRTLAKGAGLQGWVAGSWATQPPPE